MNNESVKLVLRTYDIDQNNIPTNGIDNNIGTIRGNNGYITWKNINLRDLMGHDFYDKYNKFNISLQFYSQRQSSAAHQNNYRVSTIYMAGLQWENQGYDIIKKLNTPFACVGITPVFSTTAGDSHAVPAYTYNWLTFNKGTDVVDLTVDFRFSINNVVDGLTEKSTVVLGHHTLVFQINGCE